MSDELKSVTDDNSPLTPLMHGNPLPPTSILASGDANSTNNPSAIWPISNEELNLKLSLYDLYDSDEERHSCPGAPRPSYSEDTLERCMYRSPDSAASNSNSSVNPNTRVIVHTDATVCKEDLLWFVKLFGKVTDKEFHFSDVLSEGSVRVNGGVFTFMNLENKLDFLSSDTSIGEGMVKHGSGHVCPLGCDLL